MKTAGIIAEYNPFHSGHKYQIELLKKDFDAIVIIMSGSFVQRGEAAVFDKWSRCNVALKNGADLVIELPVAFSAATAERFAFGAVSILNSINVINSLSFGSECGDIQKLKDSALTLINEPDYISEKIKKLVSSGIGYAAAREQAYHGIIDSDILKSPNNLLSLEYIRHLILLNSDITPITHKRIGGAYHDTNINTEYASASAIRQQILNNNYKYEEFNGCSIHRTQNLFPVIAYNLRTKGTSAFNDIFDVTEGIENRIINSCNSSLSFDELINTVCTKRYTKSKIRRILLSALLGITNNMVQESPEYFRVLGASQTGIRLLSEIKEKSQIQIITKAADFKNFNKMFDTDILSTDIYELCSENPKSFGLDFKNSPIIGGKLT